jgi:hypothetical protein
MLRIKSSTNAENFIKIGDHFCTVWLRSGEITLNFSVIPKDENSKKTEIVRND